MVNTYRNDTLDRGGGGLIIRQGEGTIFEKLRISRMSRMVDRDGDGAGEGVEGTDYLTRRRGLYMKNYECH